MPKLLRARPPKDPGEERQVRKLAASRHAPGELNLQEGWWRLFRRAALAGQTFANAVRSRWPPG